MTRINDFLRKVLIAIVAIFISMPGFAVGDVGEYGSWATEANRELVTASIIQDLNNFGPTATPVSDNYVPIDAKLGLAFMGGMTTVINAVGAPLVRFAILFMLIAYAFWVAFEAYNLIGSGGDAKETVRNILIKGIWISVWLIALNFGLDKAFAMIMMPVVYIGNIVANVILTTVTSVAGFSVPDICPAIHQYVATNAPSNLTITADAAASLLCIPSQMSSFFVTTMEIGWKWVISAVGHSLFSAAIGLYVTYLSIICIWKFLVISLGVIADLFLSVMLLPFTAIAETTANTKYKGVAGDLFNSFLGIFKAEDLKTQINRVVTAALYFVCLAVAISVSTSLLAFIIDPATGKILSADELNGFAGAMVLVLTLLLVCYMADKAKNLAQQWGGKIDSSWGENLEKDAKKLWSLIRSKFQKTKNKSNDSNSGSNSSSGSSSGAGGKTGGSGGTGGAGGSSSGDEHLEYDIAIVGSRLVGKYSLFFAMTTNRDNIINSPYSSRPIRTGDLSTPGGKFTTVCLPSLNTAYGTDFLIYAIRSRLLLYIIDGTKTDWVAEYNDIRNELSSYGNGLTTIKHIVVITKTDAISPTDKTTRTNTLRASIGATPIVPVSTMPSSGLDVLQTEIDRIL